MSIGARRASRASKPIGQPVGNNLLVGKVFSSNGGSHPTESGPIANATDQNAATRWISAATNPVVMTIDLEGVYTLNQIRITWAGDTVNNHTLSVSTDDSTYTQIATGTTNGSQTQAITYTSFSATARGRYLRITCVDRHPNAVAGGWGNSIWEVEAYGVLDNSVPVGTVSNFNAVVNGTTSVALSWNYTGAPITNYSLKRNGSTIASPTATTHTDSAVTAGSSYTYSVTANYQAGGTSNTVSRNVTISGGTSGSKWLSGATGDGALNGTFGTWRGEPLQIAGGWLDQAPSTYAGDPAVTSPLALDIGVGPVGQYSDKTNFWTRVNNGEFDSFWTNSARTLKQLRGSKPTYIRPYWEWNGDWYAWSVSDNQTQINLFKTGWERTAALIRAEYPEAKLMLGTISTSGAGRPAIKNAYPNGVDILSIDYYNRWPHAVTQSDFNNHIMNASGDNSLEKLRLLAESKGQAVMISEWQNSNRYPGDPQEGGGEAPDFITAFYNWCSTHAGTGPGQIVGEIMFNWQNHDGGFGKLYIWNNSPNPYAPQTAERYRSLQWPDQW